MSLLQEAMEDFAIVKQVTSSDGYGGEITEFETLSTFKGALVFNTSSEILVARSQNVVSAYTLTTNKDVILGAPSVLIPLTIPIEKTCLNALPKPSFQ